jgi:hypothetical protein
MGSEERRLADFLTRLPLGRLRRSTQPGTACRPQMKVAVLRCARYLMVYIGGGNHGSGDGTCETRFGGFQLSWRPAPAADRWQRKNAKSGKKFDVVDPATGQAIAAVAEADAADYRRGRQSRTACFRDRALVEDLAARPQQADLGYEAIELYTEVKATAL